MKILKRIKRLFRDNTIADLRLIQLKYRPLYKDDFIGASIGTKIGLLRNAYNAGHFHLSAYKTPKERALENANA